MASSIVIWQPDGQPHSSTTPTKNDNDIQDDHSTHSCNHPHGGPRDHRNRLDVCSDIPERLLQINARSPQSRTRALPCSDMSLDYKYTYILPVYDALVGLECAFRTIVDGSNPILSLLSFKDAGALFAICMLLWTECLKWEYGNSPMQL
jgi:hypothetical protein